MKSFLDVEGVYNPALRFAFTNITTEVFTSAWDGSPIVVQPMQTVELPHHLAVKLTGELVDKIMIGDAKADEVAMNQPYYRSPKGSSLGVPAARKVWEDQILRQLEVDEESPTLQVIRAQIRQELMADLEAAKQPAAREVNLPSSLNEFSELQQGGKTAPAAPKKPLKVKEIKA